MLKQIPKPNVLFLMTDDLRPELGCYGNAQVRTRHLDALAGTGVRFDRCYVQAPLCNPSRASMLTGRHPRSSGVLDNLTWFGAEHPEIVSLPKHFQAHGYASLRAGKIFHGRIDDFDAWTEGGQKRAFEGKIQPNTPDLKAWAKHSDRIVTLEDCGEQHMDHATAEQAIAYLRKYKDQPFFLACGFTQPHSPPTAPKEFFDLYDPAKIPLPPDFAERPAAPPGFPKRSVPPENGDLFIGREATPSAAREMIRAYWAALTWMDWNVGRVIAELERLDLRNNTLIVFCSDHGYHLGEKGKWSKHGSLFEVGTRVPLILNIPGAQGGQACPRVVQALDIYPTLSELCGLPRPEGLEGRSLKPLLADSQAPWDHPAFSVSGDEMYNKDQQARRVACAAVRTERYRYVEYELDGEAMLFDHSADPHEMKNLADDPEMAQVRQELAGLLRKFRAGEAR